MLLAEFRLPLDSWRGENFLAGLRFTLEKLPMFAQYVSPAPLLPTGLRSLLAETLQPNANVAGNWRLCECR